ncbi:MAG: LacI family DNA-binding transcriptional regulator [Christensenellales bacterium]|jgi:LacI family transcriptional regulator
MVKLKDIATRLGVSVSTVSRVVNNKDRVDPETRKRVLHALREMNYQPDENARRLKTNTSNVLGVIVPDLSNPFYALVIKGIEREAAAHGYIVIVCNTDETRERERDAVALLIRQKVAGIIAATTFDDEEIRRCYSQPDCPVVFFDNIPSVQIETHCVTIDNVRAARELTGYMIEQGHRRIYMISGPRGEYSADERVTGWRAALKAAGIAPRDRWIARGDFREESGRRIMEDFLARSQPPTAVLAANNFMAYGAIKAIFDAGLSVPEDISVGAFDAADTTGLMRIDIASIEQPSEDIGAVAAELCLQPHPPGGARVSRRMVLDYRFMKNHSVASPRTGES